MTKFVLCHHAERADSAGKESKEYPGITVKGEKETREKTKTLAKMICDLPDGSVVVLGGCSKAVRTRSTLSVFTDELRRTFRDEKDVIFSKPFNSAEPLGALKEISGLAAANSGIKVIVDFPLPMEEFIAPPGQKETAIAKRMVNGLNIQAEFFRRFFPRNHDMVLINNVHAPETDALISFLQKKSSCSLASIVNFM